MRVVVRGELVASSSRVLRVDEAGQPVRYYFPRSDVKVDLLERTQSSSFCPFKGKASYFTLVVGDAKLPDAIWSYEDPEHEQRALAGLLAFHTERFPEIELDMDA